MRVEPGSFSFLAVVCVTAVTGTVALAYGAPWLLGPFVLVGGVGGGLALFVRALNQHVRGDVEKLATDLPPELRAHLEAPPPALGAPLDPTPVEAPAARVVAGACPRCASPLAERAGAFDERSCANGCGGLVEGSGTERLLVERARLDLEIVRALVKEQGTKKHGCPSCAGSMHECRLRGLTIDLCLACGALWLDAGEMQKLARDDLFRAQG